ESFRVDHARFWNEGKELFGWTPEEAIEAIRDDGATDIVAHPTRYRDKDRTDRVLDLATGVEVTSLHGAEVAAHFRSRAEQRRKHWTSSSDDHQNERYIKPPYGTHVTTLERILRQSMPLSMILAA